MNKTYNIATIPVMEPDLRSSGKEEKYSIRCLEIRIQYQL